VGEGEPLSIRGRMSKLTMKEVRGGQVLVGCFSADKKSEQEMGRIGSTVHQLSEPGFEQVSPPQGRSR